MAWHNRPSGEVIVGTNEGAIKVRDIKGLPENDRWDILKFNGIKGVPWEPILGREGIEIKAKVHIPEDREKIKAPIEGEESYVPRRVRKSRGTIRKVGFTAGCPGCRAVNRGDSAVNHNEECRKKG